jgi:hypothetical protein
VANGFRRKRKDVLEFSAHRWCSITSILTNVRLCILRSRFRCEKSIVKLVEWSITALMNDRNHSFDASQRCFTVLCFLGKIGLNRTWRQKMLESDNTDRIEKIIWISSWGKSDDGSSHLRNTVWVRAYYGTSWYDLERNRTRVRVMLEIQFVLRPMEQVDMSMEWFCIG